MNHVYRTYIIYEYLWASYLSTIYVCMCSCPHTTKKIRPAVSPGRLCLACAFLELTTPHQGIQKRAFTLPKNMRIRGQMKHVWPYILAVTAGSRSACHILRMILMIIVVNHQQEKAFNTGCSVPMGGAAPCCARTSSSCATSQRPAKKKERL